LAKAIVISGTPGVGKTSVARKLAENLNAKHYNLSELALERKAILEYDKERDTYIIDEEKLLNEILSIISKSPNTIIFEGHYGELIPHQYVEKLIVLRLNPTVLKERLKSKGWSLKKILENVEAELIGVCTYNALKEYPEDKVCEVDVTDKSIDEIVSEIMNIVTHGVKRDNYIDWLEKLSPEELKRVFDDC